MANSSACIESRARPSHGATILQALTVIMVKQPLIDVCFHISTDASRCLPETYDAVPLKAKVGAEVLCL